MKNTMLRDFLVGVILIVAFSLFILLSWNLRNDLIIGHDVGYRLNTKDFFHSLFYLWSDSTNLGNAKYVNPGAIPIHFVEYFISFFISNTIIAQRFTFLYWIVISFSSFLVCYLLFDYEQNKRRKIYFVFASLFYGINFFNLQGWGVFWRTRFSIQFLLPIIFMMIYTALRDEKINFKIVSIVLIFSVIFNGGGSPPLFGSLVLLWSFVGLFFILTSQHVIRKLFFFIKFTLLFGITYCLLSAYWILPYFSSAFSSYKSYIDSSGGVESVTAWLNVVASNTSFLNLFRLQGISSWYDNPNHIFAGIYLNDLLFISLSFLWPLLAFSSLLFIKEQEERRKQTVLLGLVLLGLFFTAGSHPPLGYIYVFLFNNIPGFAIFRTAFYKFGPLIWMSLSMMMAYFVYKFGNELFLKLKKHAYSVIFYVAIFLIVLFYHFPFFSSNFFHWDKDFSTSVSIPNYVKSFANWANIQHDTGRILILPYTEEIYKADAYKWGYWSLDSLPSMVTNKNILDGNISNQIIYNQFKQLQKAIIRNDEELVEDLLYRLDIEYILLRKDTFYDYPTRETANPFELEKNLQKISLFSLDREFEKWIIFKNKKYIPSRFRIVQNLVLLNGEKSNFDTEIELLDKNDVILEDSFDKAKISKIIILPKKIQTPSHDIFKNVQLTLYPDSLFYPIKNFFHKLKKPKVQNVKQSVDYHIGSMFTKLVELKHLEESHKSDYLTKQVDTILSMLDGLDKILHNNSSSLENNIEIIQETVSYLDSFEQFINEFNMDYIMYNEPILQKISSTKNNLKKKYSFFLGCIDNCFLYKAEIPQAHKYIFHISSSERKNIEKMNIYNFNMDNPLDISSATVISGITGSNYIKIYLHALHVSDEISLTNNQSKKIYVKNDSKKFILQFNYLSGEGKYLVKKNYFNSISKHRWFETIALKNKFPEQFSDAVNLNDYTILESIEISPLFRDGINNKIELGKIVKYDFANDFSLVWEDVTKSQGYIPKQLQYTDESPINKKVLQYPKLETTEYLVFSETYDDGWQTDKNFQKIKVSGGLNAWAIPAGFYGNIDIYFENQKMFYIGITISLVTFVLLLTIFAKQYKNGK